MELRNATVLVTGANRGLGAEFVRQVLERGATKVYAATRRPDAIAGGDPRIVPTYLDVTDDATVVDVAAMATDVDVLVNNAGVATMQNLVTGDLDAIRLEFATHFWGTLSTTRAFAPTLARNGGGVILNVLSIGSFQVFPGNGAYAAAKAAEWQLTNSTRLELAAQGTHVLGLHLSATDTDMLDGVDVPKNDPADVIRLALDGLESGLDEVLADADTRAVKELLAQPPAAMYAGVKS
ncbi:SDR family NAD(P)-dependent oxidoreductase [Mycolicibacterium sp. P1-18]|uniref:SDR family oxidoreductase n=1 Tax=Mycolicibacterium sp. P1-18 TaxID=2024615 RepID=UPI0011F30C11|nr:SDR family oxidoreductase [Mycolicibacterium sp. P1-18]KAA0098577.1 SDR family NAD(P)-dependent oxidoreductase [Mycolicibacterium sp. P1-18]